MATSICTLMQREFHLIRVSFLLNNIHRNNVLPMRYISVLKPLIFKVKLDHFLKSHSVELRVEWVALINYGQLKGVLRYLLYQNI